MTQGNDCISPESLLALLKERRSIRRYRPDPVPDEMVEQLLEAGRWMKKLPPICVNTAFAYEDLETWRAVALHQAPGDIYNRNSNPTTSLFEEKVAAGIPEGLIRYAVGIEDVDDLKADLTQALASL